MELDKNNAGEMSKFFKELAATEDMCQETLYAVFKAYHKVYGMPPRVKNAPDHLECWVDVSRDYEPAPANCRCGSCRTFSEFVACEASKD